VFTKLGHECKIYNYDVEEIPESDVLFIGTVLPGALSHLGRFLPEKNVVYYGTVEGFPIVDPQSFEMRIAQKIPIVAASRFVKMCLETVGIPVAGVVYHGVDMNETECDKDYYEYLKRYLKGQVVFYNSGNSERKGIDRYIVASKLVTREVPSSFFVLHSGEGYVNIPKMLQDLELKNFWFTNQFGMLPSRKLNAMYKLCKIYVQASYCGGFELGIIEAFRFDKPVIAVDVEPYNEIIDPPRTGELIPCKRVSQHRYKDSFVFQLHIYSVDDLADAIIKLLSQENPKYDFEEAKRRFDAESTYPKILEYF